MKTYTVTGKDWEDRDPNNPDHLEENYCWCENCHGGKPVLTPKKGTMVFSTGIYRHPAHRPGFTLFLVKEDLNFSCWRSGLRGVWVKGKHEAYQKEDQDELLDYGESTVLRRFVSA
jgi:hypothetical protein